MSVEERLTSTILSSQEASKDIAQFKESIKAAEGQTKAKQENILNALAAALEENNQRPLRTKDNAYVYLKKKKGNLTVVPVRVATICDGVTDAKLLEISKKIAAETGNVPTLLDTVYVAVKQQVEEVCCPETESVAVCSRRPGNFGNVEAKEATPQVERQVAQYLQLNEELKVVSNQKKRGVNAFKAKEMKTSSELMQLVGTAIKDGNTPSVNMRFVPAPPSQKNISVLSADEASSEQKVAAVSVENLPKVPASLEAFVKEEEEEEGEEDEDEDEDDRKHAESVVLVPGLQNTVKMQLKLPEADAAKKAENKVVMPKSTEFIACLTKDSVYKCIQPVLIASGTKKEAIHSVIVRPVTQELLHQIWTGETRKEFTMAMLKLHETVSASVQATRAEEKAKKAAEKVKKAAAKPPASKRAKK